MRKTLDQSFWPQKKNIFVTASTKSFKKVGVSPKTPKQVSISTQVSTQSQ